MWPIIAVVVLGSVVLALVATRRYYNNNDLPPGPSGYPIVGYRKIGSNPLEAFRHLETVFGPVFSFYLSTTLTVVVNQFSHCKEILSSTACADRPQTIKFHKEVGGNYGLISENGQTWTDQRKFVSEKIRTTNFESKVGTVICNAAGQISLIGDKPIKSDYLNNLFQSSFFGLISYLLFDNELQADSPALRRLLELQNARVAGSNIARSLAARKWSLFLPHNRLWIRECLLKAREIQSITKALIERQKASSAGGYISAFLARMQNGHLPTAEWSFTDQQLIQATIDLFQTGTEGPATTMLWAVYLVAKHQELQARLYSDLMPLGRETPTLKKVPLLMATLYEIQRYGNVQPIVGRFTTADINLDGYRIPKGTAILVNLSRAHRDPQMYQNPNSFDPDRFMTQERPHLLVFGGGKRQCIGQRVGFDALLRFVAQLVIQFEMQLVSHDDAYDFSSIRSAPPKFEVRFLERAVHNDGSL